jgi:hypothetical protein
MPATWPTNIRPTRFQRRCAYSRRELSRSAVEAVRAEGHEVPLGRPYCAGWKDVVLLKLAESEARILLWLDNNFWQIAVQRRIQTCSASASQACPRVPFAELIFKAGTYQLRGVIPYKQGSASRFPRCGNGPVPTNLATDPPSGDSPSGPLPAVCEPSRKSRSEQELLQ